MKALLCYAALGFFLGSTFLVAQSPPADAVTIAYQRSSAPALAAGQKQLLTLCREISFRGIPYKFGGTSGRGMDCSASIQHVLGKVGITLPRTADQQANRMAQRGQLWRAGARESEAAIFSRLRPGALLFWARKDSPNKVSHVMMFIGMNGKNKARLWGAQQTGRTGMNGSGVDYYPYTLEKKSRSSKLVAYGHPVAN